MSVRAYRVIQKELADGPSFNLWHDQELIEFLRDNQSAFWNYSENLDDNGGGTIEVSVGLLQKAVDEFEWDNEDDYRKEAFKEDIAFAKAKDDDYVIYECY